MNLKMSRAEGRNRRKTGSRLTTASGGRCTGEFVPVVQTCIVEMIELLGVAMLSKGRNAVRATFVIWWRVDGGGRRSRESCVGISSRGHLRVKPPARSHDSKLFRDKQPRELGRVASCVAKGTTFSFPGIYGRIARS